MAARKSAPSKYTPEQVAYFRKTHRDFKGGSLRAGDASVLQFLRGKGTCIVPLEAWPIDDSPAASKELT